MKKLLSVLAALMIIFTFSLSAFATDTADTADTIDTSTWITHEIPELGISLALPQGTKVYTRDSLAKGNLDNDPNYDKAVEDFKLESRYFWALNLEENIDLDLKMNYTSPFLLPPYNSFNSLNHEQLTKLLVSLNADVSDGNFYSICDIDGNVFIQHPVFYKSKYVFYLYSTLFHKVDYAFDFRAETIADLNRQLSIYKTILSTVNFNNVPRSPIYFILTTLLTLILFCFIANKIKKSFILS